MSSTKLPETGTDCPRAKAGQKKMTAATKRIILAMALHLKCDVLGCIVVAIPRQEHEAWLIGSLQLRVLRLGLFQNRNAGIGIFPKCQELLISSLRLSLVSR